MIKTFIIGEKSIEFKASAATPIIYKKTFSKDLLSELTNLKKLESKDEQAVVMSDLIPGLAYIMYCEARMSAEELFTKLSQRSYIEWLMTIEAGELIALGGEFIRLYQGNMKSDNKSKNA